MDYRTRKYFIRISKINNTKDGIYTYNINEIYDNLKNRYEIVLFIEHYENKENIHYHICIQNKDAIRFETIKKLIPYGDIEKQLGTNQDVINYMLHKGKDKEYDESEIIHNFKDYKDFIIWLNKDYKEEDTGIKLIYDIENSTNLYQVIKKNSNLWARVDKIKLIWDIYIGNKQEEKLEKIREKDKKEIAEISDIYQVIK